MSRLEAIVPLYRQHARVRGGHPRVEGTRVGVHDVIGLLQTGETVDSLIARCLPTLHAPRSMRVWPTTRITAVRSMCWWRGRCAPLVVTFLFDDDVPDDLGHLLNHWAPGHVFTGGTSPRDVRRVDWGKARVGVFPDLAPSTETISLRLPTALLSEVKALASKQDVPYQSLLKIFLADRVARELIRASSLPGKVLPPPRRSRRKAKRRKPVHAARETSRRGPLAT